MSFLKQNCIIISFCITVYKQYDLVKKCIESIIEYKGNNIEIIVSDDSSSEDIKDLVKSYSDKRIKYYANNPNLGHDLNIINSFTKAKGLYAFLLTSRCQVISECIPYIIEFIQNHPNCSYITGNAIEEDGNIRYSYKREVIRQGYEAINSLFYLYNHPAGSLYSLSKVKLVELKQFLEQNALNKQSFSAHCMMRMQLAEAGDFGFVCRPMWKYIRPHKDDIAVNTAPNKLSVYDPYYLKQRCNYKLMWCKLINQEKYWDFLVTNIFKKYLRGCTWEFYYDNSDRDLQNHYGYSKRKYSLLKERKNYINNITKRIMQVFGIKYYQRIKKELFMADIQNIFCGWEKIFAQKILKNTQLYKVLGNTYKKIMLIKL